MCGMEWGCQDGVVIPYRPETLFEIVAESDRMMRDNPDYSDVMGDGRLEQWAIRLNTVFRRPLTILI